MVCRSERNMKYSISGMSFVVVGQNVEGDSSLTQVLWEWSLLVTKLGFLMSTVLVMRGD